MLPATSSHREESLAQRRGRLLGPAYRLFYDQPLHPVQGAGAWLRDADGMSYLDAYNNVASVGHCHPHVVQAIARQAATLNTHTRYLHEGILDYAERLLDTLPPQLGNVMFTCTGSEANDLALRIAAAHTGASGLIVTRHAYHGVTAALAQASPALGSAVTLGPDVRTVAVPQASGGPQQDAGARFAAGVRAAIADLDRHGLRPAALLVDTVFSSDGIYTDPPGFLAEAVRVMHEAGGLFIADEVQAGLGRTGDAFWGFARHDVQPDIVTMGKPLGNGHPLAGLAVRPEVLAAFGRQCRYFNTFGGNPVSMAAGVATLEVIEREGLMDNARRVGQALRAGLAQLQQRHPLIADVRGAGLFIGVELRAQGGPADASALQAARVVNRMRERQVLLSATGPHGNILKIRPPLVFSDADADLLLRTLDEVLAGL